ncbi:hypothetical protein BT93_G0548 [Corymbia citriodora subsp. variegata]|nr:hypothetical protein BT93_G0548 [Corymbia citriodora subsp. variegata]
MRAFRGIIATIVVGVLCACIVARGAPNTAVVSSSCNSRTYTAYSPYDFNLRQVLSYITYKTADSGYSAFTESDVNGDPCYGHGACYGGLTHPDCTSCLKTAASNLWDGCPMRVGGQIQLQDCRIRYENYPFSE